MNFSEDETARSAWKVPLVLCVVVHVLIVVSIVRQPLAGTNEPAARSLTWPLHFDSVHRGGPGIDFFSVYHGGVNLAAERSPFVASEPERRTPYFFPFRYLPVVAGTLGRVAQQLPPAVAWRLWIVVLEASLAAFLFCLLRRRGLEGAGLSAAALLISTPYFLELHMGQFTFLCTVLVLGAGIVLFESDGASRSLRWLAGSGLTMAFLLKVFPLVVAPVLLRWRGMVKVALSALAATVLLGGAHFLAEPADWAPFIERNFSRPVGGMDSGNHSPLYLVLLLGAQLGVVWNEGNWFPLVSAARYAVLGVAAFVAVTTRRRNLPQLFCLLLLAHFVSYSHYWEHHASAVVAIGAVMLCFHDGSRWTRFSIITCLVLLVLPTPYALLPGTGIPSLVDPGLGWGTGTKVLLAGSKALPTLALFVLCLWSSVSTGLSWTLASSGWWFDVPGEAEGAEVVEPVRL